MTSLGFSGVLSTSRRSVDTGQQMLASSIQAIIADGVQDQLQQEQQQQRLEQQLTDREEEDQCETIAEEAAVTRDGPARAPALEKALSLGQAQARKDFAELQVGRPLVAHGTKQNCQANMSALPVIGSLAYEKMCADQAGL